MQPTTAPAPTTSAQALQNLNQFQSSAQTPDQSLQAANQSLGVQGAQQTAQGLQGAINNTTNLLNQVVPTVQGNTQNSLVTSSQAGQQEQNAAAPLQSTLDDETNKYDQANSAYQDLEDKATNQVNATQQSQTNQLSYLQNIYNDLATQEQNAAQAKSQSDQFNQSLAEQKREADLSSSSDSGVGSTLASLFGSQSAVSKSPTTPTLSGGKTQQDAYNDLQALLKTNATNIQKNFIGIQKSANNGNTYDQEKLKLINSMPDFAQYLANSNQATF